MANEIFTRLQLKHDTYNAWEAVKDTFRPLPGEICIVEVPAGSSAAQTAPTVLFKVGQAKSETENYTFAELPWASALAADVYAWAKKPEAEFITWVNEQIEHPTLSVVDLDAATKKFITNIEVSDHEVTITRSDVEWDDIVSKPDLALKSDIPTNHKTKQTAVDDPTANGKAIAFIDSISQNENGEITATKKTVNLDEYAKKEDIPESVGVMAVGGADAIKTEGTSDVTVSLGLDNSGNVTLSQSKAGLKAEYKNLAAELKNKVGIQNMSAEGSSEIYFDVDKLTYNGKVGSNPTTFTVASDYDITVLKANIQTGAVKAGKLANQLSVGAKNFDGSAAVTITAADLGLDTVMHFIGAFATAPTKAFAGTANERALANGDVYLNTANATEYVYSNGKWVELGNEEGAGSHALKTVTITGTGYLTGGGSLEANRQIDIASDVKTKIDNGATAYGWGNHAEAGYLKSHQDISGKKNVQSAIADQNLSGAKVIKGIAQNEQGVITVSTRDLTPADIGAQPAGNYQAAGNYKTTQTEKNYDGSTVKTVTNVKQNANGEVEVTYSNIAFPEAPTGSGSVTMATKNADGTVTLNGGVTLDDHTLLDDTSKADVTLHKMSTTGSIYDVAEGAVENTGSDKATNPKYLVFNCGTATTVI